MYEYYHNGKSVKPDLGLCYYYYTILKYNTVCVVKSQPIGGGWKQFNRGVYFPDEN